MRDYRLEKDEKNYVLSYKKDEEDGNLLVKFADDGKKSTYFEGVPATSFNIKNLDIKMQSQIEEAIKNKHRFILSRNVSLITSGLAFASSVAASYCLFNKENLSAAVLLCAGIPTFVYCLKDYIKENRKVKELKKAECIEINKEKLDNIKKYPNALAGVKDKTKEFIYSYEEPFKANNLDKINQEDIDKIIANIEREEEFNFIYEKKENLKIKNYVIGK